jgi:two-component system, LytTR family, sensor kinase
MINPFLKYFRQFLIYLVSWLIVSSVEIVILSFSHFRFANVFYDVLVHNIIFALLGLIIWYPVYFSNIEKKPVLVVILTHLASVTMVVLVWVHLSQYILSIIIEGDELYTHFLRKSHFVRSGLGVLFYIIIVLFYYLAIYYNSFQEKLLKEADLKSLVKESELASLKAQINPHFLFNSLNSVSSLTMTNPSKAQEMIIKLAEFLRYSIGKSQKEKTTLKSELENIQRYLDIEKTRFDEKLDLKLNLAEKCETSTLPNMLLQPLIENAIKHGVYENTETTFIHIDCYANRDYLEIFVRNNFDPNAVPKKGAGVGLKNIAHRLGIIYNRNDLIRINREERNFEVRLLIPQDKSKEI